MARKSGRPRRSLPRRVALGLGLSLAVIVALLLAGELLVRMLTDLGPPRMVIDARIGKRYRPDLDTVVHSGESGRDVRIETNRYGFRFPDLPYEKPAGTRRLALIGDSMIAAEEVLYEETAAYLLEQRLDAADPEHDWEVLNFGMPGSGTAQQYVLYRELVRDFDPDVVLCAFFAGNDFSDNSLRYTSRRARRIYFDFDASGELVQLAYPILDLRLRSLLDAHCRLYQWQKVRTNAIRWARSMPDAEPVVESGNEAHASSAAPVASMRVSEWIFCADEDEDMAHSWAVTEGVLARFAAAVAEDAVPFALVLIPDPAQVVADRFAQVRAAAGERGAAFDGEHPNRRLGVICGRLGIPLIDPLPDFRAAAPSRSGTVEQEWLYLNGFGHFHPRGHAALAEVMARRAAELFPTVVPAQR